MARLMFFILSAISLVIIFGLMQTPATPNGVQLGSDSVSTFMGLGTGLSSSAWWSAILGNSGTLVLLGVVGALSATLFARVQVENYIILAIAVTTFVGFIAVFSNVVLLAQNCAILNGAQVCQPWGAEYQWISMILKAFFFVYSAGFLYTIIEEFRQNT